MRTAVLAAEGTGTGAEGAIDTRGETKILNNTTGMIKEIEYLDDVVQRREHGAGR